jgi:hypothetical protein
MSAAGSTSAMSCAHRVPSPPAAITARETSGASTREAAARRVTSDQTGAL